jgi:exodeoxyribonuclease X
MTWRDSLITKIVVLDTEGTSVDTKENDLLEVAWQVLERLPSESARWTFGSAFSTLIEFNGKIPCGARGVHHISEEMVRTGSPFRPVPRETLVADMLQAEEPGELLYAAHNAPYDSEVLPELTLPWLCTYRTSRILFPDADSHKNQSLRYELDVDARARARMRDVAEEGVVDTFLDPEVLLPHRALYDCVVTACILLKILEQKSVEDLLKSATEPVLLVKWPFGKYRGEPTQGTDPGYLRWYLRQAERDPDVEYTCNYHLYGEKTARQEYQRSRRHPAARPDASPVAGVGVAAR